MRLYITLDRGVELNPIISNYISAFKLKKKCSPCCVFSTEVSYISKRMIDRWQLHVWSLTEDPFLCDWPVKSFMKWKTQCMPVVKGSMLRPVEQYAGRIWFAWDRCSVIYYYSYGLCKNEQPTSCSEETDCKLAFVIYSVCSHHINQLGDLESKANFNGVVGVLDRPDPALVPLEKVPQQGVLHLRQGDKLTLTCNKQKEHGSRIKYSKALIFPLTATIDWFIN